MSRLMGDIFTLRLTHPQMLVLQAIANYCNGKGEGAYPSQERLVWMTGYDVKGVRKAIRELVSLGVLVVVEKASGRRSARYRIDLSNAPRKEPLFADEEGDGFDDGGGGNTRIGGATPPLRVIENGRRGGATPPKANDRRGGISARKGGISARRGGNTPPDLVSSINKESNSDLIPSGSLNLLADFWNQVLRGLVIQATRATYETLFVGSEAVSRADGVITIAAKTEAARMHMDRRWRKLIEQEARRVDSSVTSLVFIVAVAAPDVEADAAEEGSDTGPRPVRGAA